MLGSINWTGFLEHLLYIQTLPAPIKREEPAFIEHLLCARHFTGAISSSPHSISVTKGYFTHLTDRATEACQPVAMVKQSQTAW